VQIHETLEIYGHMELVWKLIYTYETIWEFADTREIFCKFRAMCKMF